MTFVPYQIWTQDSLHSQKLSTLAANKRIIMVRIFVPVLELNYVVTNFKIY